MNFRRIGVAITAAAAGVAYLPYLLTTISPYSICISDGLVSSGDDKVRGALDYVGNRMRDRTYPVDSIVSLKGCCRIDKGVGDDPRLSWFAYVRNGESHYVHVPSHTMPFNAQQSPIMKVIVDNCGNGKYLGVHL